MATTNSIGSGPLLGSLSRRELLLVTLFGNIELAAVVAYFAFTNATVSSPLFTLYGLTWVNVSGVVFWRFDLPSVNRTAKLRAAAVAVPYAALLAVFGGLVGPSTPTAPPGFAVSLLPPGWGPALAYGGEHVSVVLLPAKVLGYGALVYLLYGSLVDASRTGLAGILGLFSCVSCSFPILAGAVAAVVGGGGFVAALATGVGYGPSTAVFLVSVGLLWWRPDVRYFGGFS